MLQVAHAGRAHAGQGVLLAPVDDELGRTLEKLDELGRELAAERGLPGRALVADLRTWTPEQEQRSGPDAVPPQFDLIVAAYFQHDLALLRRAAEWLVPGGRLLWITHAPGSVEGPPPTVPRPTLQETVAVLEGKGLDLLRAEQVRTTDTALDVVVEALRPR